MNMTGKIGWALAVVLAAGLGWMSYTFLVRGNVELLADGRTAVMLLPDERTKVLGEMRGLLEAVQAITEAASQNDMNAVAEAATAVGMGAARAENPQLIAKLPLNFKMKGMAAHKAFDDLATLAGETDDGMVITGRLSEILSSCTSCHGGYRLGIETADSGN